MGFLAGLFFYLLFGVWFAGYFKSTFTAFLNDKWDEGSIKEREFKTVALVSCFWWIFAAGIVFVRVYDWAIKANEKE